MDFTSGLNDRQKEAVLSIDGPLLIIAGAGSGKTRVITHRIAHMLTQGIPQSSILALTFTNKAAREMSERVRELTKKKLSNLTVSTFHAFGVQILRKTIHLLPGYRDNFSIYDQADKNALIKECARELGMAPDTLDLWEIGNIFSSVKTFRHKWDGDTKIYEKLFHEYQEHLQLYNAVDFDDLIVRPIHILQENPEVLESYRERFQYVMVDEFQDTSMAQYQLMKILSETNRNICVVGDDDQSIYSWRGANYENIINFERDFPELTEIKLEQNYRSTGNILAAANGLIAHNTNRKEKELWTGTGYGNAIEIYYPENEQREAEFITTMIRMLKSRGEIEYHDVGVLIRTNSLSATLEDAFLNENIPYRISGGTSFFQRKEIKDLISYLRIMSNPDDDMNLLRIINTPRRGIGKRTLQRIQETAQKKNCSIYSAISALRYASDSGLGEKAQTDLSDFVSLIEYYREQVFTGKGIAKTVQSLVDAVQYWPYLIGEHQKNESTARWKYANICRFIEMIAQWEETQKEEGRKASVYDYLNRITLITRDDDQDDDDGRVNIMTIHAAKGLEFSLVFLAGVEAHLVPHARAVEEDPANLEEERRLFYVAITRAREKLYITSCRSRRNMRDVLVCEPSPFLTEIPEGLIEDHIGEDELSTEDAVEALSALRAKFASGS
ncbi:UvrD-helicase domain-containing protein [Marispirochaeta aestuarii]|uniref:ATP-dependent helicase n=1 Tax=Marispirochaeta aestuarii TaxID=1963862 RepID=UPI002ABD6BFF|nr:UvrD-helicase domain-containing protein [Marispirochaeta aestuarii]